MPLPYATPANVKRRLRIPTTDTEEDSLLSAMCEEVNTYIESVTRRAIGSSSVTSELIDGGSIHIQSSGYIIDYPRGIRNIDTLELRTSTTGDYETVPATDYFIGPEEPYRTPGWPGFYIQLTDLPASGNTIPLVYRAFGAIRLSAPSTGWAQMPADLRGAAEVAVARAWKSKEAGFQDDSGVDELGELTVSRFLSGHDYRTIRRYRWEVVEIID